MSRLLFTCRPLSGHFDPLLPLAEAAREAGHSVAFATGAPFDERARAAGYEAFRAGPGADFRRDWAPRFPGWDRLVGDQQRRFFFTEVFANIELGPRAVDLDHVLDAWGPDLVLHDVAELAAPLVCAQRGLPCVDLSFGPLIPATLLRAAGEAAGTHWRARGLEPDEYAGLLRYLYVDICPAALQNPEIAAVAAVQSMRPAMADLDGSDPPDWLEALPDPIVYLTLGTVWNTDLDVFRAVIAGLRDQAVSLVVTVGRQNDPAALGPQPDTVCVHRYVAQASVLPRCQAAVNHAGAGTLLGALAAGLPLLLLPQGADQHSNADRVVAAGAGLQLLKNEVSRDAVRTAMATLLGDPSYRAAAQHIGAQIAGMPTPTETISRIMSFMDNEHAAVWRPSRI